MSISVNAAVSVNAAPYSVNGNAAVVPSTASFVLTTPIQSFLYGSGYNSAPTAVYEV